MKWKLSVPEPGMLVYYFMKFMGVAPFTVKKNRLLPSSVLAKVYSVIVASGHLFFSAQTVYPMLIDMVKMEASQVTILGTIIQTIITVPGTFLTVVTFLYMRENVLYIANKLRVINNELKSLGVEQNEKEFLKNTFVTMMKTNAFMVLVFVPMGLIERHWSIVWSIKYSIDNWAYVSVILVFTRILFFIGQCFKLLNKKLLKLFGPADHRRSRRDYPIFVMRRNITRDYQSTVEDLTDLESLRKIQVLYLELCDLVERTTRLFAIPILWKSFQSCTEFIMHIYWIYYCIRNFHEIYPTARPFLIDMLYFLLILAVIIVQFIIVAKASVETCEEGNATKAVMFRVWYKHRPRHLGEQFVMFSVQLLQKPIVVSVMGLFNLDYSYPYKISCIMMSFVIIMIQFDKSEPSPGT